MQLALLALALSIPNARGAERSSKARGDVKAKLDYCKDCHGRSAQGFHGYFPIPRLAGQQPEYLKNQLQAFIEHRRTNNIMFNVAHSLSPAMIDTLAADFRELNPPPLGGGREAVGGHWRKNIPKRRPRSQRCRLCCMPRPGSPGKRRDSSLSRPAFRLHLQQTSQLEQGTRTEPDRARHIGSYVAGCTQSDQTASRSHRRLPQLSQMTR